MNKTPAQPEQKNDNLILDNKEEKNQPGFFLTFNPEELNDQFILNKPPSPVCGFSIDGFYVVYNHEDGTKSYVSVENALSRCKTIYEELLIETRQTSPILLDRKEWLVTETLKCILRIIESYNIPVDPRKIHRFMKLVSSAVKNAKQRNVK